jgi:hypothetical protein
MTHYILEDADAKGVYYVNHTTRRGQPTKVEVTNVQQRAAMFSFMTLAIIIASELPGRWRTIHVETTP